MHYAVPRICEQAGILERFYTDSYVGNKPWLEFALRAIQAAVRSPHIARWLGRKDDNLPARKVRSFEILGIWYALARIFAKDEAASHRAAERMVRLFSSAVIRQGFGGADTVFGYNGASRELFLAGRQQGKRCILEQTILPKFLELKLMDQVAADWPGWQPGLDLSDRYDAFCEREKDEWTLADQIIVGSKFVADGLQECGVSAEKIRVVPYGVDVDRFASPKFKALTSGPLRVLFAGQVGLRKGAPYLLEALRDLGPGRVQARFAGEVALDAERIAPYREVATFLGAVPRMEMPELFHWADVFVLPSIVEGSATSTYEALVSGLPVVATPNSGTIVTDGVEGRIIPERNAAELAEALKNYCEDRDLLAKHAANAVAARGRAGIERYYRDLETLLR